MTVRPPRPAPRIDPGAPTPDPRPAHRPRRDPGAARVPLAVRVHPDTRAKIEALARAMGVSQGQIVDEVIAGTPQPATQYTVPDTPDPGRISSQAR